MWLPLARPPLGTWPAAQTSAPAWESNQRPFGLQAAAQSTEPHQPGPRQFLLIEAAVVIGNDLVRPCTHTCVHASIISSFLLRLPRWVSSGLRVTLHPTPGADPGSRVGSEHEHQMSKSIGPWPTEEYELLTRGTPRLESFVPG